MSSTPEVRVTRDDTSDTFPYAGTRVLGAVQLNIGIFVFILGMVDIVLTLSSHDRDMQNYGSRYETVVSMTVVSSPLWCGLWFSIGGALGVCMTRDRSSTVLYCKVACLVLNILCCALFGPVCAIISAYISYTRHNLAKSDYQWLITLIVCFLSIIEVVMATVSASVTCCCSSVRSTQVHIFVKSHDLNEKENDHHSNRKSETHSQPSLGNTHNFSKVSGSYNNSKTASSYSNEITNNHSNNRTKLSPSELFIVKTPVMSDDSFSRQPAVNDVREPVHTIPVRSELQEVAREDTQSPPSVPTLPARKEVQEEVTEDTQHTSSYVALKKWALPNR